LAGPEARSLAGDAFQVETLAPQGSAYPVPASLKLRGKGLIGRISLGSTLLDVDPLDALPTLLRMVYSFGGKPRHLWVEGTTDVTLKSPDRDAVLRLEGAATATLIFPDALPSTEP